MFKIIVACCFALAVANDNAQDVDYARIATQYEDFINMHQRRYDKYISNFDRDIKDLKDNYLSIEKQLAAKVAWSVERRKGEVIDINTVEFLTGSKKECAEKYLLSVPNITQADKAVYECFTNTEEKLQHMLDPLLAIRFGLKDFYDNKLQRQIVNCLNGSAVEDLTSCIDKKVKDIPLQFEYEADLAKCVGKANIRHVDNCISSTHESLMTRIIHANKIFTECLKEGVECEPCSHECSTVILYEYAYLQQTHIKNIFYNTSPEKDECVILASDNLFRYRN